MSSLARSILLVILIPAGVTSSSTTSAQPSESKSQALAHTRIDGNFARYLESPNGDIDGVVLEDGRVARFASFNRVPQTVSPHPGDAVRIEGDVVSGLAGVYLVHALVTRINIPSPRGAVSPSPVPDAPRPRSTGKGAVKDRMQPPQAVGKPQAPSTERKAKAEDVLVVGGTSVQNRKKGRLESIESKAKTVTTGKDNGGKYSQWGRTEETAGP